MDLSVLPQPVAHLAASIVSYLKARFEAGSIGVQLGLGSDIRWSPTLQFTYQKHTTIAVEVDPDSVYPQILKLNALQLLNTTSPVAVYAACPEEVFTNGQREVADLRSHGFGLLTVSTAGHVVSHFPAIPLIQCVPEKEVDELISALPKRLRVAFREAYIVYRGDPSAGLQKASQVVESEIDAATTKAVKLGWLPKSSAKETSAKKLDLLAATKQLGSQAAAIGGVRHFIKTHRNPSSHPARTKRETLERLKNCKSGFVDSLKLTAELRAAFAKQGLKIT